jgi:putative lipoic acid-binding regulatory protein
MAELESVIEYPLDFPIKIMGLNQPTFVSTMTALVKRYAPDFDPATLETRPSREGKYLSLTATIRAVSREQLDGLYQALSDHPMVSAAL